MMPQPNRGDMCGALLLMFKRLEANRKYREGLQSMSDQEYDALEASILVIDGKEWFDYWTPVGHDLALYDRCKQVLKQYEQEFKQYEDLPR